MESQVKECLDLACKHQSHNEVWWIVGILFALGLLKIYLETKEKE